MKKILAPKFIDEHFWLLVIAVISFLAAYLSWFVYDKINSPYWQGVASNIGASFWDILLAVVLLNIYSATRSKQDKIQELRRRINDFKKLDTDYGHAIIGASLRELAEHNITDIDFRGIQLTNFSFFNKNGVQNLRAAIFADGLYFAHPLLNFTKLTNVDFSETDCSDVLFGKGNLASGTYKNCSFCETNLRGTKFSGCALIWDSALVKENEETWSEVIDTTIDDEPIYGETYRPAFQDADLYDANFDKTRFQYADFRGAKNILNASFYMVSGIETCFFDDGVLEQLQAVGKLICKNE